MCYISYFFKLISESINIERFFYCVNVFIYNNEACFYVAQIFLVQPLQYQVLKNYHIIKEI